MGAPYFLNSINHLSSLDSHQRLAAIRLIKNSLIGNRYHKIKFIEADGISLFLQILSDNDIVVVHEAACVLASVMSGAGMGAEVFLKCEGLIRCRQLLLVYSSYSDCDQSVLNVIIIMLRILKILILGGHIHSKDIFLDKEVLRVILQLISNKNVIYEAVLSLIACVGSSIEEATVILDSGLASHLITYAIGDSLYAAENAFTALVYVIRNGPSNFGRMIIANVDIRHAMTNLLHSCRLQCRLVSINLVAVLSSVRYSSESSSESIEFFHKLGLDAIVYLMQHIAIVERCFSDEREADVVSILSTTASVKSNALYSEEMKTHTNAISALCNLVTDNTLLQRAANDTGLTMLVSQTLYRVYSRRRQDRLEMNDGDANMDDMNSEMHVINVLKQEESVSRLKRMDECLASCLRCLGALMGSIEEFRRSLCDTRIMSLVAACLTDSNSSIQCAACFCLKSLTRSIKNVRLSLNEYSLDKYLMTMSFGETTTVDVQIAATAVLCNLVLDYSPFRRSLMALGILTHCSNVVINTSLNPLLQRNCIWILKNITFFDDVSIKGDVLRQLPVVTLLHFASLATIDVAEQSSIAEHAWGFIRNLSYGNATTLETVLINDDLHPTSIFYDFIRCFESIFDTILNENITLFNGLIQNVVFVFSNLCSGSMALKCAIVQSTLLHRINFFLTHSIVEVRLAALWAIINLTWRFAHALGPSENNSIDQMPFTCWNNQPSLETHGVCIGAADEEMEELDSFCPPQITAALTNAMAADDDENRDNSTQQSVSGDSMVADGNNVSLSSSKHNDAITTIIIPSLLHIGVSRSLASLMMTDSNVEIQSRARIALTALQINQKKTN